MCSRRDSNPCSHRLRGGCIKPLCHESIYKSWNSCKSHEACYRYTKESNQIFFMEIPTMILQIIINCIGARFLYHIVCNLYYTDLQMEPWPENLLLARNVGMDGVEPTCNLLRFLQLIRLRRYIPIYK